MNYFASAMFFLSETLWNCHNYVKGGGGGAYCFAAVGLSVHNQQFLFIISTKVAHTEMKLGIDANLIPIIIVSVHYLCRGCLQ